MRDSILWQGYKSQAGSMIETFCGRHALVVHCFDKDLLGTRSEVWVTHFEYFYVRLLGI